MPGRTPIPQKIPWEEPGQEGRCSGCDTNSLMLLTTLVIKILHPCETAGLRRVRLVAIVGLSPPRSAARPSSRTIEKVQLAVSIQSLPQYSCSTRALQRRPPTNRIPTLTVKSIEWH